MAQILLISFSRVGFIHKEHQFLSTSSNFSVKNYTLLNYIYHYISILSLYYIYITINNVIRNQHIQTTLSNKFMS